MVDRLIHSELAQYYRRLDWEQPVVCRASLPDRRGFTAARTGVDCLTNQPKYGRPMRVYEVFARW